MQNVKFQGRKCPCTGRVHAGKRVHGPEAAEKRVDQVVTRYRSVYVGLLQQALLLSKLIPERRQVLQAHVVKLHHLPAEHTQCSRVRGELGKSAPRGLP